MYLLSGKLYSRILCILTDLESKLDDMAFDVQEGENSHCSHEDGCCNVGHLQQEISQDRFFLLIVGKAIEAKITEPQQ